MISPCCLSILLYLYAYPAQIFLGSYEITLQSVCLCPIQQFLGNWLFVSVCHL
jgi:hypothetical protein